MCKRFLLIFLLLEAAVILPIRIDGIAASDGKGREAGCRYALSPAAKSFDSEGGTGRISVTATSDCPWKVTSNAPSWITILSGASGAGRGTVRYRVAPNNGISRSGTVTVAGRTFAVDQTAAPCCEVSAQGRGGSVPAQAGFGGKGEGS